MSLTPEQAFKSIATIQGESDPDKLVESILNLRSHLSELHQEIDIERQRSEIYKQVGERIKSRCVWIVIEGEKDIRGKYYAPYPGDHVTAIWKQIDADVTWEKEFQIVLNQFGRT